MTDHEIFEKVIKYVKITDTMTVMQFGVASGNTLIAILDSFKKTHFLPIETFGFDSFSGLPKEQDGIPTDSSWIEGAFNLVDEISRNNFYGQKALNRTEGICLLVGRIPKEYLDNLLFIPGFYSDTLNAETVKDFEIKPASFVDIDCDLYISAKQVLDFLFQNNLLLDGCIVRYDDWNIPGLNEGVAGESLAHFEAVQKYNAVFERLRSADHDAVFRYKGRK